MDITLIALIVAFVIAMFGLYLVVSGDS